MDTTSALSPDRFASGITIEQFVSNMEKNRDIYESNYSGFSLREDDEQFFRGLQTPLKVMVLAEDWCGDVLRYLPVFAKIAPLAKNWDVRVFRRDENLDLADMCLKDGKYRAIPVFKFFDEALNEKDCFIERPALVYEIEGSLGARFAEEHPDLPGADLSMSEMSDATREEYLAFLRQFRAEQRERWQQLFVDAIREKAQNAGG